jgi:hypothetical protein
LGATFALVELRIVLREVLRRVELDTTTAPGERQRVKAVILVPHRGARIRVKAIHPAASAGPTGASEATGEIYNAAEAKCPVAQRGSAS